jgi:hypothetical protein
MRLLMGSILEKAIRIGLDLEVLYQRESLALENPYMPSRLDTYSLLKSPSRNSASYVFLNPVRLLITFSPVRSTTPNVLFSTGGHKEDASFPDPRLCDRGAL